MGRLSSSEKAQPHLSAGFTSRGRHRLFLASFVMLGALAVFESFSFMRLTQAQHQEGALLSEHISVQKIATSLRYLQSARRGFAQTGAESLLSRWEESENALRENLLTLRADPSFEPHRLSVLQARIGRFTHAAKSTLVLRRAEPALVDPQIAMTMQGEQDVEQILQDLALLQVDIARRRDTTLSAALAWRRSATAVAVLSILATIGISVCGYLLILRESRSIERHQREALRQALEQRDALVDEVHHRIKNHLQGVAGLMEILFRSRPDLAEARDIVIRRLRSIGVVHGLQGAARGGPIRLTDLVSSVAASFEQAGTTVHVTLRQNVDQGVAMDDLIRPAESVPIAMILNELTTNAAKHASAAGPVAIELGSADAGLSVTISNPGTLPREFDIEDERTIGTGLRLARSLLPLRGARLTVTQAAHGYVVAVLHLREPVLQTAPEGIDPARPEPQFFEPQPRHA